MIRLLREALVKSLRHLTQDVQADIARRVSYEVRRTQRRIVKSLISFFMMALAIIFLTVGAVYLGVEYFAFSKTIAFLIVGIVLLIIGIVIKLID